ncbi:MAG: DUF2851 family protein [Chitinophagaceae bacterium]|nr:DUF2851 family protein [Chitinophagaceae bacterium]
MTERLLQYIWQFQYFNKKELQLSTREPLQIIHPGQWNIHQGPDFLQSTIKIGDTKWIGNIELHVQTSDWFRHEHQHDKNYNSVILHVVWNQDTDPEKSTIPILSLEDKVPKMLLRQYEDWMMKPFFIPCEQQIGIVNSLIWTGWRQRLLIERLQRKTGMIEVCLAQSNQHWEEVFWWMLARNFGIKVNAEAFETVARSLPVNILVRHKNQIVQLEALLLGQAGLLDKQFEEKYPRMLQKEYNFYRSKYKLDMIREPVHFLRMRPENFPTIRLAQLAMLIHRSSHLFSRITETADVSDIKMLLDVTANDYWHYHYRPGEPSAFKPKKLGDQMVNNIIINTVVPVMFAFGHVQAKTIFKEKALQWLEEISAEKNSITDRFAEAGVKSKTAFDSQSIIELKNVYCDKRRCLDCAIGNSILKRNNL